MSHYHAAVWLDHAEAHVMHISPDDVERSIVRPEGGRPHLHVKSGIVGSGHRSGDAKYYHEIAEALRGAQEILIVGPGQAKVELMKHLQKHDPQVAERVVGIESIDHPTDNQLVAYARRYFHAKDQMLGH
jgi:stalled ribosome rescue protein Dom34